MKTNVNFFIYSVFMKIPHHVEKKQYAIFEIICIYEKSHTLLK